MSRFAKQLDSVLVKPAGPDCNLACRYCFYLEKERLFPHTRTHRMSPAVLRATVSQMMTQGPMSLAFGWQGGEPTLMGVDFFQTAVDLQKEFGRSGQVVGNGLQTNGLLIDADWCRFLRDAKFLVGLSLDGPQHVHDHYRVGRGGQPTWQRVNDAAKRMLDAGVEVNALTVLSDYSAQFPREIYAFLKEQGLHWMQFIPCLERDPDDPARVAPFSVAPEQYGEFLCDVFDCWIADFRDGKPTTYIRWFESVFATYVNMPPRECTLLPECGSYVVVEHNGDVFACDFYVERAWRLGNVTSDELNLLLNSARQARFGRQKAELPQACQNCRWLPNCRGGCPKDRWGNASDPKLNHYCEAYKRFFAHADERMRKLAEQWLWQQDQQALSDAVPAMAGNTAGRAGRNDPCPCGSGRKFKRCCGR